MDRKTEMEFRNKARNELGKLGIDALVELIVDTFNQKDLARIVAALRTGREEAEKRKELSKIFDH